MNDAKTSALEETVKKHAHVEDLNNNISRIAKESYLAGDSPEVFHKKVGAAIDELGEYIKENF